MPPTSAWCPRDAVKKIISSESGAKTGVMIVMSGRWLTSYWDLSIHNSIVWDSRAASTRRVCHEDVAVFETLPMELHLELHSAKTSQWSKRHSKFVDITYKLIDPR